MPAPRRTLKGKFGEAAKRGIAILAVLAGGALQAVLVRPNVRAKLDPTVGRQARAGDNVQRTACPGLVARRWGSA